MSNVADRQRALPMAFKVFPTAVWGSVAADFSRDGLIDIYITNYYNESNNLYHPGFKPLVHRCSDSIWAQRIEHPHGWFRHQER